MHILNNSNIQDYSNDQQAQIFDLFSIEYIRQTINNCKKSIDIQ